MATNIGPRIGIDGEAEYRKSIQNIIQETKTLKSEYEKISSSVDGSTSSFRKNKELSESLKDRIAAQTKEVEKLSDMVQKSSDKFGDADTKTLKWKEALNKAETELNNLKTQLKEIPSQAELLGKKFEEAGNRISAVGDKVSGVGDKLSAAVTAPLVGLGTVSVKSYAEVDKTMTLTNETMGSSAEQAKLLSDAMKTAAANSVYGMNDAATASLNFARAGLTAEQAASVLAPAMNLAAGEGGDLDTVSAGLIATINAFHGSFDDASYYADVFAAACNNSALDIDTLANNITTAAPVFASAGYNVQDLTLAMGLMGDNGIDASAAATSLKTGIARLVTPAKAGAESLAQLGFVEDANEETASKLKAALQKLEEKQATLTAKQLKYNEAVKKYGEDSSQAATAQAALTKAQNDYDNQVSTVDLLQKSMNDGMESYGKLMVDNEGNMRSFGDVLTMLHESFAGLSEAEQIEAASNIFGKQQFDKWLGLINSAPEHVDDLTTSIANSKDTADGMAEAMMSGFGGSLEKLKSSADVAKYSFGESLAPTISKVADVIQNVVDAFNSLDDSQRETIAKVALAVAAIGPVLAIGGRLITGIGSVIGVVGKLLPLIGGVASFITGTAIPAIGGLITAAAPILASAAPFLAIGAVIIGVGVAIYKNWDKIKEKAGELGSWIKEKFDGIKEWSSKAWDSIKTGVSESLAGQTVKAAWKTMSDSISSMKTKYEEAGGGFKGVMAGAIEGVKQSWTAGFHFLDNLSDGKLSKIKDKFSEKLDGIRDKIAESDIGQAWSKSWDALKQTATDSMDAVKTAYEENGGGLKGIAAAAMTGIKEHYSAGFHYIDNLTGGKLTKMSETFTKNFDGIKETVSSRWTAVKDATSEAWDNVKNSVEAHGGGIKGVISTMTDGYKKIWENAFNKMDSTTNGKLSDIRDAFSSKFNTIKDFLSRTIDKIKGIFDFDWHLPDIKLPHFSFTGSFSLNPLSVPSLNIDWYKKANNNAYLLDGATIFGQRGGNLLGGGEAGQEIIIGTNKLIDIIQSAIGTTTSQGNVEIGDTTINVYATENQDVREVAEAVSDIIGQRYTQARLAWV